MGSSLLMGTSDFYPANNLNSTAAGDLLSKEQLLNQDPTKNRVKLRKNTKNKIKNDQPRNSKGQMIDPNTGKVLNEDETDIGHKPGEEWKVRKVMRKKGKHSTTGYRGRKQF